MSGSVNFAAGRFKTIKDGRVAFDTQTPAARLAPSKTLLLTNYEIEFPDLWKGIFYTTVFDRDGLGLASNSASSYIALVGQEWGPDEASPNTLADIVLGVAPAGANYLNIRVNLTNTVVPGKIAADVAIMSSLPAGKWTRLAGTSCRLESHGPLRRTFDILLSGGNIVLRRRQSVIDTEGTIERKSTSLSTSLGPHYYYLPGTPGTNAGYSNGHYASVGQHLQNVGPRGNDSVNPGGSNAASTDTSTVSYRSVWAGSIAITPGRVG